MASGKSSFILYCDLIHTVEKLPDDKAGLLLKHILRYVNDLNPDTDDLVVGIAFEPVKQGLKRDLRKWEEYIEKQRENGKRGGRPPKTQAFPKKPKPFLENPTEAKKADSVSVSVSVTDSENKKKENIPSLEEFMRYAKEQKPTADTEVVRLKYLAWVANDWKDGKDAKIKNWKSKLLQTLPHMKESTQLAPTKQNENNPHKLSF